MTTSTSSSRICRFPLEHRKRTRSTNLLERTFVEVRRRTKDHRPLSRRDQRAVADLGVLELASRGWRGITMTPKAIAQIERLRRGHTHAPTQTSTEDVIAA